MICDDPGDTRFDVWAIHDYDSGYFDGYTRYDLLEMSKEVVDTFRCPIANPWKDSVYEALLAARVNNNVSGKRFMLGSEEISCRMAALDLCS